jgi:epoxyqueuosine reductase
MRISFKTLRKIGSTLGIHCIGFSGIEPLSDHYISKLEEWQEKGYAGACSYMLKNASQFGNIKALFPAARSIILFTVYYERGDLTLNAPRGYGRVARYAWGKDYHKVFQKKLRLFVKGAVNEIGTEFQYRIFSDAVPLLERYFALRANFSMEHDEIESSKNGLQESNSNMHFIGKNTMMIHPKFGSFSLIAGIASELEIYQKKSYFPILLKKTAEEQKKTYSCGECTKCIDACPTSAIVNEYTVDARLCISYLTIEKRGMLDVHERTQIGDWLLGCDICQEVCPFNYKHIKYAQPADLIELQPEHGAGRYISLDRLLKMRNDEAFYNYFAGTPFTRLKREGVVRNAAIVAANTLCDELLPLLKECFEQDSSPVIRSHTLWSWCMLAKNCGALPQKSLQSILKKMLHDQSSLVVHEADSLLEEI